MKRRKKKNKYHIFHKQKCKTQNSNPSPIWIIIETNMMFFLKKVTYFQYFAIFCCAA